MRRKILFGVDYTDSELIKLLLYLFVGGTAALVEWALFYLFFHYLLSGLSLTLLTMLATALSFAWQHCIIISWAMFWFLTAAAVTNAARSLVWCFW